MDKMSCLLNPLAWKVSLIPCNQHLPKWVPQTHEKGYLLVFFYGDKGNEENDMSNIVRFFFSLKLAYMNLLMTLRVLNAIEGSLVKQYVGIGICKL
jgi:hypothetical protein